MFGRAAGRITGHTFSTATHNRHHPASIVRPTGPQGAEISMLRNMEVSDGPVEVCVPVNPPQGVTIDAPTRKEPAHHEAYVRISKRRCSIRKFCPRSTRLGNGSNAHGLTRWGNG